LNEELKSQRRYFKKTQKKIDELEFYHLKGQFDGHYGYLEGGSDAGEEIYITKGESKHFR
jgi:hypothetical protein